MGKLLLAGQDLNNPLLINWPYSSAFEKQHFLDYESLVCEKTHGKVSSTGTNPTVLYLTYNQNFFQCDDEYCPINTTCSCIKALYSNLFYLFTTQCILQNLTTVPQDVNPETEIYLLAANDIWQIQSYSFANLVHLNTLVLSYNIISTIEDDAFLGLNNLTQLYLPYNKLNTIKSSYFKHLDSLIYLELQVNKISYIEPGSFDNLLHLEYLDLSNNQLSYLPDPFLRSQNLVDLYLQNNTLTKLPTTLVAKSPIQLYIRPLDYSYYVTLDLTDNQLTSIPEGFFDSDNMTKKWEYISLESNHLTFLSDELFGDVGSELLVLYIQNNNLTTLSEEMRDDFRSDIEIALHGNPWNCDCKLQWLSTYLYGNGSEPRWWFLDVDPYIVYCDRIDGQVTHIDMPIWNVTDDKFLS